VTQNQDGTGQHIWLRYATQYIKDGRTHTIEMGIPIPIGASAERRAELLHEAEVGMSQLVQHVEQHIVQAVESAQHLIVHPATSHPTVKEIPSPSLSAAIASMPTPQPTPSFARQDNRSASIPAPHPSAQLANNTRPAARHAPPGGQPVEVPPTRQNIGSSMPTSLNPANTGSNLTLPEFINYISQNLHLDSRQAMKILQVKSLSGINLRDALEYIKRVVAQKNAVNASISPQLQVASNTVREVHSPVPAPQNQPVVPPRSYPLLSVQEQSLPASKTVPEVLGEESASQVIETHIPQSQSSPRRFDEEEEITLYEDLADLEELESISLPPPSFSQEQREQAQSRIQSLREKQGTATADPARLKVLRNTADADISNAQLQELANGIWHQPGLQRLKLDQVEELISWAKKDAFLEEVKVVLAVLKEV
jgi:hypothetical protein